MKHPFTTTSKLANALVVVVLALVPFHAFLTIWASTLVGHYTALRLWDDVLTVMLMSLACVWLVRDKALRAWFMGSLLVRLIAAYAGLTVLLGVIALTKGDVTLKALAYGVLVNLRFLAWFLAVLLTAHRSPVLKQNWPKLLLVPAVVVAVFAVVQYKLLPHDFLAHFGYRATTTIAPIETINHNTHYIRVQSTLRGANPLGAYLVIVLSVLAGLSATGRKKLICAVLAVIALGALYASGSRSAWIGVVLSGATIAWFQLHGRRARLIFGAVSASLLVAAFGIFLLLRHNAGFENALLHTQTHSQVATSSNSAHANATKAGLEDVLHQPLGDGPGTAGPASVYNGSHPSRIAENYYVQIAQEVGWLGLALFLCIVVLVALELYSQVRGSRLALVVLASLIGLSFVNLLSHAWVDDSLAYLWWGLAGIALAGSGQKQGDREV